MMAESQLEPVLSKEREMRNAGLLLIGLALLAAGAALRGSGVPARDGAFIHISHGSDDPHRALTALKMAEIMQEQRDVLVYFDVKGVEVCLQGAPDNQSVAGTDKPEKLHFLRLTRVLGAPGLVEIDAGGVRMETRCHGLLQRHPRFVSGEN
jgi:hypothetical protein